MDMRNVLIAIGVRKFELGPYAGARINYRRELPLDLILYLVIGVFIWGTSLYSLFVEHRPYQTEASEELARLRMLHIMQIQTMVTAFVYFYFGLVALARRVWLSKNSI